MPNTEPREKGRAAWRAWKTDGDPTSGAHEPAKSEIREFVDAVGDVLESNLASLEYVNEQIALVDTGDGTGLLSQGLGKASRNVDLMAGKFFDYMTVATPDTFILNTDGTVSAGAGKYSTGFIEVSPDSAITRHGITVTSGTTAPYAFYDAAKTFLGYAYATVVEGAQVYLIANAPAGTKYVRLTAQSSSAKLFVYDARIMQREAIRMFSTTGLPVDRAGTLQDKYVHKTTGVLTSAGSIKLAGPFDVTADTFLCSGADLIGDFDTNQCQIAFFGPAGPCTISIASPGVITKAGHGYTAGKKLFFGTSGALPTGLAVNTVYYVLATDLTTDTFKVSTTDGGSAVNTSGTQSGTHTVQEYLGYYNPRARWEPVKVGDHYPTAATCYVSMPNSYAAPVYILAEAVSSDDILKMASTALVVDFFADDLVTPGRLTATGDVIQPTSPNFRTTNHIYGVPGQIFLLTFNDFAGAGGAPVAASYDEDGVFIAKVLEAPNGTDFLNYELEFPEGATSIRVTFRNETPPYSLRGVRAAQVIQEDSAATELSYLMPADVVGRVGENVYVYADGIRGDASVPLSFGPQAGEFADARGSEVFRLRKTDGDDAWVDVRALDGKQPQVLGRFNVKLADVGDLVSPTDPLNIVPFGDSTTSQLVGTDPDVLDGDGTWVNECSRQLTGTGTAALSVGSDGSITNGSEWGPVVSGDIRTALSLTNIHFRGTRGAGPVKHEGRAGWETADYLTRTEVVGGDGKFNPFWDPSLERFSMKYYLEENEWTAAFTGTGVETDGSNLLVPILLGWNDYAAQVNPATSAANLAAIADYIHAEYPAAKVWLVSLWAAPSQIFKPSIGGTQRFISQAEIFNEAVRPYGEQFRSVAEERADWCKFVQVSHQMDPETCFSKSTMARSNNTTSSTLAIAGAGDHVHMRRRGYDALARVIADRILYDYCRDV